MERVWDRSLSELWCEQVARTPEAVAVRFGGVSLTYRQLDERAQHVAAALRRAGVRPGSLVATFTEPSAAALAGLVGVIRCGAAYLPLDPSYPREQLRFMLDDAQVRVALVADALRERLPASDARVLSVEEAEHGPGEAACARPGGHALAYVMYTSGSTGRPKGVSVPQRAVARLVIDADYVSLGPADRVAQVSNWSFDAATFEIWGALLNGATLIGIPRGTLLSPPELARTLRDERVSVMFVTTALFNLLAREAPHSLRGLRAVLFGGEAVNPDCVRLALEHSAPASLLHVYGPTENTTFSTWHAVAGVAPGAATVPIGRAVRQTYTRVLDGDLRPVPEGGTGELFVGGAGLADGYLRRPDLTAERFVPDPTPAQPGARLYRTGDLVRAQPGGCLEFLGRADHQVKLRGFRIEPGEIESTLRAHPGVAEALVVPREDQGEKRLVAYVAPRPGAAPQPALLRAFAAQHLPAHMMPSAWVLLERLPLTPNGKVDRRALPAPRAYLRDDAAQAAAGDDATAALAAIWSRLLNVERVAPQDDFLELGGHSLLVMRLLKCVREELGVELKVAAVFENTTLERQAALVAAARSAAPQPAASQAPEPPGDAPLSFSQEAIWILQQLQPESRAYHFQAALRLRGPLDTQAFERSLAEIVRRHAIFRTTFHVVDDTPVQRVHAAAPCALRHFDLRDRPAALPELIERELARPFDLTELPLLRLSLARIGEQEHVLVHVEHHLLHDGWSYNVFLGELATLYHAFRDGRPSPLPEPARQFADFARWQRAWIGGEEARAQIEYWRRTLAGSVPLLDLPTDRPRPPLKGHRGALLRVDLPVELCRDLRAFSRGEHVTLFVTLLGAFYALLARYTGQTDLALGCGMANRGWPGAEQLVGMFINTVVLRADLGGDPSVRELLARLREVSVGAFAHQDLPFERLVDALRLPRDPSLNPLFQAAFSFHDAPLAGFEFPGLEVELTEGLGNGSAKFDLNVIAIARAEQRVGAALAPEQEAITLVWEYRSDLFDAASMERMLGHYRNLLAAMVQSSDRRLSTLPLMGPAEHSVAPASRGGHETLSLHERFEAVAAERPAGLAVVWAGREVRYGDLNARANRLARWLRAQGVGPETVVGLCVERSLEMLVGMLGVLKAGGAFLPLDPAYPAERLRYMIENARLRLALTKRGVAVPRVAGVRAACFEDVEPLAPADGGDLPRAAGPDHLAYVIYTSGSTGAPKGALLTHRGLANFCVSLARALPLGRTDRVLQCASSSFDASIFEIAMALPNGAALCLAPPGPALGGVDLVAFLREHGVTATILPPSLLAALPVEPLPALRTLITGGDACSPELVRRWGAGRRFFNAYGPTEVTVWASVAECAPEDGETPIGRPVLNVQAHVLDARLEAVPAGVAGELFVGGPGVARGYLGRPDLTAQRFVPDPFGAEPGARLYRTGDLVRLRRDGQLDFLGRVDEQVKVRGFRVEPAEIEAALKAHPQVCDAAVAAREHGSGDRRLLAFVVPRGAACPDETELRTFLWRTLPAHMIPSAFVTLTALPLTSNGKLDRRALLDAGPVREGTTAASGGSIAATIAEVWADLLGCKSVGLHDNFFELGGDSIHCIRAASRLKQQGLAVTPLLLFQHQTAAEVAAALASVEPSAATAAPAGVPHGTLPVAYVVAGDYAPPRGAREALIAEVWAQVLGLTRVGRDDNFFELGGDSIHCIRVVSRLTQRGLAITPLALFQYQTVAQLAAASSGAEPLAAAATVAAASPHGVEDQYPLAPIQHGLLFHALYEGDTPLYHEQVHLDLLGPLQVELYERAFAHVSACHPVLRSVFRWDGVDEPQQLVLPVGGVALRFEDLSAAPAEAQQARIESWCREDWARPYELDRGPLMRLALFRLAAERFRLVWSIHHILFDGWSLTNLLRELAQAYEALVRGELPPGTRARPYREYVEWVQAQDSRAADAFWRRTLGGFDEGTPLPWDRPPHARRTRESSEVVRLLPLDLARPAEEWARRRHITLASLLRACWAVVLAQVSGRLDVVFGVTVSGRPAALPEVEWMVGPLINTLPVRARLDQARTLAQLAEQLHVQLLEARAYEYCLLPEVQKTSGVPAGRNLFDSLVVHQNYPIESRPKAMGPVRIEGLRARDAAHHDLVLTIWGQDALRVRYCYATDVFEAPTVERLADQFEAVLRAFAADPETAVADALVAAAPARGAARLSLLAADLEALLIGEESAP